MTKKYGNLKNLKVKAVYEVLARVCLVIIVLVSTVMLAKSLVVAELIGLNVSFGWAGITFLVCALVYLVNRFYQSMDKLEKMNKQLVLYEKRYM
jgi:hypothetical protein